MVTISPDSVFVHKMWADKEIIELSKTNKIPFPMLADTDAELAKLYATYDKERKVILRGSFIIDPEGILQAMEVTTTKIGRDFDEILRKIKAMQMFQSTGHTAPCAWKPGQKGIAGNIELVGNMKKVWTL